MIEDGGQLGERHPMQGPEDLALRDEARLAQPAGRFVVGGVVLTIWCSRG